MAVIDATELSVGFVSAQLFPGGTAVLGGLPGDRMSNRPAGNTSHIPSPLRLPRNNPLVLGENIEHELEPRAQTDPPVLVTGRREWRRQHGRSSSHGPSSTIQLPHLDFHPLESDRTEKRLVEDLNSDPRRAEDSPVEDGNRDRVEASPEANRQHAEKNGSRVSVDIQQGSLDGSLVSVNLQHDSRSEGDPEPGVRNSPFRILKHAMRVPKLHRLSLAGDTVPVDHELETETPGEHREMKNGNK